MSVREWGIWDKKDSKERLKGKVRESKVKSICLAVCSNALLCFFLKRSMIGSGRVTDCKFLNPIPEPNIDWF